MLDFKSSPRNKGNRSRLADQVVSGAKASGAMVESHSLHNMTIHPCDACYICQETGVSVLNHMQIIYPRLRGAYAIILASPIYWFAMSAHIKLFIDHWHGIGCSQGHPLKGVPFG